MTRILTDGAEFGDGAFFELGNAAATQDHVRSGNYAYFADTIGTSPTKLLPTHMSEFYIRWCSYLDWVGDEACWLWGLDHHGNRVTGLFLDTSGKLHWYVGGTDVAIGTYPFQDAYWHLLDCYIKIHGTSGSLMCKLDGVMDVNFAGNTQGNGQTEGDRLWWSSGYHLGFYPRHYFDDIALNDVNGAADNTWCGDGHIERLSPNNDGDVLQWVASTGGSHFQTVDDMPPNGDTDYIGTIQPNKQDMFHLTSFDDTNKLVRRVYSEMRARDMSAVGQVLKLGVKTSGSVYLCSADRVLTYNYTRVVGDEMLVDPNTGLAWTKDALDAMQFVVNSENIIG